MAKIKTKKKKTPSVPYEVNLIDLREAVANYMQSEGCSCCRDVEAHKEHEERLAKLLYVRPYDDGSGYDFGHYAKKL